METLQTLIANAMSHSQEFYIATTMCLCFFIGLVHGFCDEMSKDE